MHVWRAGEGKCGHRSRSFKWTDFDNTTFFETAHYDGKALQLGSLTEECVRFLSKMVQARYSILVGGGTGSGKTTFLGALSEYIPNEERIITIEDNAELRIQGIDNLVRLEQKRRIWKEAEISRFVI